MHASGPMRRVLLGTAVTLALAAGVRGQQAADQRTGAAALFEEGLRAAASDELPLAAHAFRRVLVRVPGQPAALHNLELATAALDVPAQDDPRADGLRGAVERIPPSLCLALIAGLQGLGLVGFVLARRRRGLWLVPATLGLALAGLRAHYLWNAEPPWATVLAPRAPLRTEAATDGTVVLTLRAGEAVRADLWQAEWVRVRQGDDAGWVERASLAPVD